MKKLFRFLSFILLASFAFSFNKDNEPLSLNAVASQQYVTEKVTYYNSIDTSKVSGTSLLGALHDLTVDNHKTYTAYDDVGKYEIQMIIDADPNSTGRIIDFYSQSSWPGKWYPTSGNVNGGYNREHLWCQSHSNGLWGKNGGGADMQHIRPLELRLNSTRNNNEYGLVTNKNSSTEVYAVLGDVNSPTQKELGGYLENGTFEPLDVAKGDVARILMYLYMHYNKASLIEGSKDPAISSYVGNLPITNIMKTNNESEAWSTLLTWNNLDPVSIYETNRNELASKYQGNRNPFIDYPDLAKCIWGDKTWNWSTRSIQGQVDSDYVSLDKTSISLNVNEIATLTASSNKTPIWTNSNSNVLSLSGSSNTVTLKALSAGSSLVTVTSGNASATCLVTVNEEISAFSIDKNNITMQIGETQSINANKNASWSVSPTGLLSLSSNKGTSTSVTALSEGNALISATYEGVTLNCDVTISSSSTISNVEERKLTLLASDTYSTALPNSNSAGMSLNTYRQTSPETNLSFGIAGVYKPASRNYFLLYNSNSPYIFNYESLGTITNITITFSSTTSENGKVGIYLSNTLLANRLTDKNNLAVAQNGSIVKPEMITSGLGYFQISSSSTNVQISKIEITYKLYSANLFAIDFISKMDCDPTGNRRASESNWLITKTLFTSLNDVEKNLLQTSMASISGTKIEEAMHYYDYIIYKYGSLSFENYINRSLASTSSLFINSRSSNKKSLLIVFVLLSIFSSTGGIFYFLKQSKIRDD